MALKMPRTLPARVGAGGIDVLEYEIVQEKAANLARLGRRLEQALKSLAEFDAERCEMLTEEDALHRERLVAEAGEALWYYVIQREVCGLRDGEAIMRELRVPREVRLRMGFFPSRSR